jgi:galactose mutarotase-like enzyme
VLFPIVGKLKDDTFEYQGHRYQLGQHGFGRSQVFEVISQEGGKHEADTLVFELRDTPETKRSFPFAFRLQIRYTLRDKTLHVAYHVSNPDEEEALYFSIGAHPGFRCPIFPGEQYSDYEIHFSSPETAERQWIDKGIRTDETSPVFEDPQRIGLYKGLFKDDALIFTGLQSDIISLRHKEKGHGIALHAQDFPHWGIWAKANPDGDFVCLEPWHGIADAATATGHLAEKEGIICLLPGEQFHCVHSIEVKL